MPLSLLGYDEKVSVKCPTCRFESPDGAEWCEFCKEPFRRKGTPTKPPDPASVESSLESDSEKMPEIPL